MLCYNDNLSLVAISASYFDGGLSLTKLKSSVVVAARATAAEWHGHAGATAQASKV
jgi:hypothetical protein